MLLLMLVLLLLLLALMLVLIFVLTEVLLVSRMKLVAVEPKWWLPLPRQSQFPLLRGCPPLDEVG